jgi:DNA-binding LacI/PurR family transcriptional regulator
MARLKLEDAAERAGVSVATASRVVDDSGAVRPATRNRVLRVISQLKYHPNFHARTPARGSTRTLGMIVSNLENPFSLDIFKSLEAEARRRGYEVLVANTDYVPPRLTASLRRMMERRGAGLAVIVSEMEPSILEELSETELPIFF